MKVSRASPRAARIRSRSRAVSTVPTVGEDGPAVPLALVGEGPVVAEQGLRAAAVVGTGSTGGPAGVVPALPAPVGAVQVTGLLRPTPRGSNETMSKRSSSSGREHGQLVGEVVDARGPRPARVDDQGPDPLPRAPRPDAGPRRSGGSDRLGWS